MKKFIFLMNAIELLDKLVDGKRVEGVLYIDQDTGRLTFKPWNRTAPKNRRDVLIRKLPWGWVKESLERIKVHGSFPKEMGMASILGELDGHHRDAKKALVEKELDLIEFC